MKILDRWIFIYAAIGLYMFARYAFKPTCEKISNGFYLWMTIITSATRPLPRSYITDSEEEIGKSSVGFELIMIGWGFYVIFQYCFDQLVWIYSICDVIIHIMYTIYYVVVLIKNRNIHNNNYQGLLDPELGEERNYCSRELQKLTPLITSKKSLNPRLNPLCHSISENRPESINDSESMDESVNESVDESVDESESSRNRPDSEPTEI